MTSGRLVFTQMWRISYTYHIWSVFNYKVINSFIISREYKPYAHNKTRKGYVHEALTGKNSWPRKRKSVGIKAHTLHDIDIFLYLMNIIW
jgi:hypothetical protein